MDWFGEDLIITITMGTSVILIIIIILGSYHHVHRAGFKPKFRRLSDGSVQMIFSGFAGIQTTRTKRFYEQYKIGMVIEYQGKKYEIEEIKEQGEEAITRRDLVMVCYLQEVK